jgi:hypothetical protein
VHDIAVVLFDFAAFVATQWKHISSWQFSEVGSDVTSFRSRVVLLTDAEDVTELELLLEPESTGEFQEDGDGVECGLYWLPASDMV